MCKCPSREIVHVNYLLTVNSKSGRHLFKDDKQQDCVFIKKEIALLMDNVLLSYLIVHKIVKRGEGEGS